MNGQKSISNSYLNSSRSSLTKASSKKKKSNSKTRSFSTSDSDSNYSAGSFLSSSASSSASSLSKFDQSSNKDESGRSRSVLKNRSRESLRSKSSRDSFKSSTSSRSSSNESAHSSDTNLNLSRASSLKNLEAEYEPVASNLPLNVYQTLFSIKNSNLKIYTLDKEFQENERKIRNSIEEMPSLTEENRLLAEKMVTESCGAIALVEVTYGSIHWKLAIENTRLAVLYLETSKLPKQAKIECEKSWTILFEDFRHQTRKELQAENDSESKPNDDQADNDDGLLTPHIYPDCNKHQMMLNYIYGRASTLLKQNKVGQSALESAEDYCARWASDLKSNKERFLRFKKELQTWRQKVYFALAKQYAINRSDKKALENYDKCLKILENKKSRVKEAFDEHDLMIKIYKDKAKIELEKGDKESFLKAVDFSKLAIQIAEESGILVLIGEAKLNLAKIFAQRDDQHSSSKAEEMFLEVIGLFTKATQTVNSYTIKTKDELVKFYLKLQRYEDAIVILNELAKEKADFYGDFSLKLDSTYKMLCSTHLVKNDQVSATKFLQKSLEIEEMNYGNKDKRYLETKQILENLKKNEWEMERAHPNSTQIETQIDVLFVLLFANPNVKTETDFKPVFQVKQKIDYSKSDYKLFSPVQAASEGDSAGAASGLNESKSARDESLVSRKINPLK